MSTPSLLPSSSHDSLTRRLRKHLQPARLIALPMALLRTVAEIAYPRRCPTCKVDLQRLEDQPSGFCQSCAVSLDEAHVGGCSLCGAVATDGTHHPAGWRCDVCESAPPPYRRAVGFWRYGGALREAIVAWKNQPAMHLSAPLGDLYTLGFSKLLNSEDAPVDAIVPVPSLPTHLAKRGFNTAATLGEALSRHLASARPEVRTAFRPGALRFSKTGLAARGTRGLGRRKRLERSHTMFEARPRLVANQHIWLVDDVMTTGATAAAATRALLEAGAASVSVGVLARVEGPRSA